MEQTISKQNKLSYKLSILIRQDGLSFCVSQQNPAKVISFSTEEFSDKKTPEELLHFIENYIEYSLEDYEITDVLAIYGNQLYSFVPRPIFKEEQLSDYLKYSVKILKTDVASFDELSQQPINNVYIPYVNINNYLFENFGAFTYKHACTILTEYALQNSTDKTQVYVNFQNSSFDVCVVSKSNLLLCNSFIYETAEDFLYYLLFTFEQLSLNTEKTPVFLMGNIKKESDYYKLLYKYVKEVTFVAKFKNIETSTMNTENLHNHHLLLSSICE